MKCRRALRMTLNRVINGSLSERRLCIFVKILAAFCAIGIFIFNVFLASDIQWTVATNSKGDRFSIDPPVSSGRSIYRESTRFRSLPSTATTIGISDSDYTASEAFTLVPPIKNRDIIRRGFASNDGLPSIGATVNASTAIKGAKMVLLLAYQRTGSSYIGNLFNMNPDAHYIYEPIDGIYSSLYGTKAGWNVASDIFNMPNGERRILPAYERESVARTLYDLLACNTSSIPVEVMAHPFWVQFHTEQRRLGPLATCLFAMRTVLTDCQSLLAKHCPERFGLNYSQHEKCRVALQAKKKASLIRKDLTAAVVEPVLEWNAHPATGYDGFKAAVALYKTCLKTVEAKSRHCSRVITSLCPLSRLRAVKTVRLDMKTLELLLDRLPPDQFRVIHLFREPVAVARSRMGGPSYRGVGAESLVDVARLYCADVIEDIKYRKRLEAKYPRRFSQIIYEDFVKEPVREARKLYDFIGEPFPKLVENWFRYRRGKNVKRNGTRNKEQERVLSIEEKREIGQACGELYEMFGDRWKRCFDIY